METNQSVHSIFQDLLQQIQLDNKVKIISDRFSAINSNSERVSFVYNLLKEVALLPKLVVDEKCDDSSVRKREEGNVKFKNKKLNEAADKYTECLAFAPEISPNYSKALANRSAALFELELYDECLNDINRALENNYPKELQPKLLKRKEKVLSLKTIKPINEKTTPAIANFSKSNSIECASKSIEIKCTESQGRHVVATNEIKIGEIIAVEKPFCEILVSEYFNHCHDCLKLCYNLIPCSRCTQAFYCDEKCRKNALNYHNYECNLLKTLRHLQLNKMFLLPLKLVLIIKHLYHRINKNDILNTNGIYKSDEYAEIHNLVGNTDKRSVADLFERSTAAAAIFSLFKNHSNFFRSDVEENVFKDLLLFHFQTAPCNFHEITELAKDINGYYETKEIGAGAFAFLSLFNHSCNPNVVRHCHANSTVVRAIRSIDIGEQCYDNYGYHFAIMPKSERIINLKKQYFFDCNCFVCENNWPLLHQLPYIPADTEVTTEDITNLRKGNKNTAEEVYQKLLPKMHELETVQPNKLFFEMQEVLKQCYALFGNVRRV